MQVDFGGVKRQNLIFWNKMKLKSNRNRNETNVTGVFLRLLVVFMLVTGGAEMYPGQNQKQKRCDGLAESRSLETRRNQKRHR